MENHDGITGGVDIGRVDKMSVFAGAIKEHTGTIKDEAKVRQFKWCFL